MLGPSEGGLGGQDAPDGFPASGRNAYPSGASAFFADEAGKWDWRAEQSKTETLAIIIK